jgi:hypothetical protein
MERPSQPTLTRYHRGPDSPPGFGIMPHGPQKDSETIPRASDGNLQSFAILGIPSSANYSNHFPRSSWHERLLFSSFTAIARQPTYKFSSPSARYPLFALYPAQVTSGTLVPPYTSSLASLSARLSSESPPHSESPARLRPAFATILLLTPHTGLPLYRYLGPPQTWSRTHAQARPGSTPPRGTHPSHGAPSPATSSRPSHGLSLTSPALPRPWSYQTWSRTRAPARPGSTFFVAPPLPMGIRLRPPAHVPPTDCAPA